MTSNKMFFLYLYFSPSKKSLEQLAKHLVLKFPDFGDPRRHGYEMWFFHSPFATSATGFLEERLKNQRKKLNTKSMKDNDDEMICDCSLNWESEDDQGNNVT